MASVCTDTGLTVAFVPAKFTTARAAGFPSVSRTSTTTGFGSGDPAGPLWPSPAIALTELACAVVPGASCVTVNIWPAISMVAGRAAPAFAVNPAGTTPVPAPPAPGLTNGVLVETWYEHPDCVTTRIGRLPAPAAADADEGLTS